MFKQMRRAISIIILMAFVIASVKSPAYAQADPIPFMPAPGAMVHLSPEYTPAYLKGIVIHPENALKFDFIIYKGDKPLTDAQKREEYTKLTKYFLASLAIPDDDQWVNLSPYEKDRIIKDDFGKTEMGRDLLAQDYLLKQITASLIYPQDNLGKEFWDKVYTQAQKQYGTTNIPVNTFNKVWILPDDALIYEKGNGSTSSPLTAYVLKNHLRVMLEEDYLSLQKHSGITHTVIPASPAESGAKAGIQNTHSIASNIIRPISATSKLSEKNRDSSLASNILRAIVLPELQREVNEDKNFAPLRQVYSGMLLATWFKRTLKQSLLGQIYVNKAKTKGVDYISTLIPGSSTVIPASPAESGAKAGIQSKDDIEGIYQQYLKAYKKGVFNFIKEDTDRLTNETIPRKYFSGGMGRYDWAMVHTETILSYDQEKTVAQDFAMNVLDDASMTMAEVSPKRDAAMQIASLRNGTEEPMPYVVTTMMALRHLMSNVYGVLQLHELHQKALNPGYQIPKEYEEPLQKFAMLDTNGQIHGSVRNIVLSAIEGTGLDMHLVNPVVSTRDAAMRVDRRVVFLGTAFALTGIMAGLLRFAQQKQAEGENRQLEDDVFHFIYGMEITPDLFSAFDINGNELIQQLQSKGYLLGKLLSLTTNVSEMQLAGYDEKQIGYIKAILRARQGLFFDARSFHSQFHIDFKGDSWKEDKGSKKAIVLLLSQWITDNLYEGYSQDPDPKIQDIFNSRFGSFIRFTTFESTKEMYKIEKVGDIFNIKLNNKIFDYPNIPRLVIALLDAFNHMSAYNYIGSKFSEKTEETIGVLNTDDLAYLIAMGDREIAARIYNNDNLKKMILQSSEKPMRIHFPRLYAAFSNFLDERNVNHGNPNYGYSDRAMAGQNAAMGAMQDGQLSYEERYRVRSDRMSLAELKALLYLLHNKADIRTVEFAIRRLERKMRQSGDNAQSSTPGGIDLNSANLNLVIKRDGNGVPLPLSQQDLAQLSNIQGLDPVILSIKPASQTALFSQVVGQP